MEKSYLQVNLYNVVTVSIMAFAGMALFGMVGSFVKSRMGGGNGGE